MPKRRRTSTDPSSHHGFLDSLDVPRKGGTKKNRRQGEEDEDSLDLDRIL